MKAKIITYGGAGYNLMNTKEVLRFVGVDVVDDAGVRHFVSQSWKDGEEPNADGSCPSELLPEIKTRLKSWLYSGGRDKDLAEIAWMEANADAIDIAWFRGEAAAKRERAAGLVKQAEEYERIAIGIAEDAVEEAK